MAEGEVYQVKDEDKVMLILSYLGILCLIPFFSVKKENEYARWHAKQGFVLFIAEIILFVLLSILSAVVAFIPVINVLAGLLWFLIWVGVIVLSIYCIIQSLKGIKWKIPFLSDFVEKF